MAFRFFFHWHLAYDSHIVVVNTDGSEDSNCLSGGVAMGFFKNWMRCLVQRLAAAAYVRRAIEEQADLSAFKERPSLRVVAGVGAILFSYVIGWPLIAVLGAASIHWNQPLVVAVGGPVAYGLSHLVFLLGMYLAGAEYSMIFLRWATRVAVVKLLNITSEEQKI
jgi:hypothetical protein